MLLYSTIWAYYSLSRDHFTAVYCCLKIFSDIIKIGKKNIYIILNVISIKLMSKLIPIKKKRNKNKQKTNVKS